MDITKDKKVANPKENANFLSKLLFTYTIGLFIKGYKKELDVEDIYNPLEEDRSKRLGGRLQKQWEKKLKKPEKGNYNPSLLKAIIPAFWVEILLLGFILAILTFLRLIQPRFLGCMLEYFRVGSSITKEEALYYAGGMVICNFLTMMITNHYFIMCFHFGMKLRVATCAIIYKKALKLSKTALGGTSAGKVINLLSNDVNRVEGILEYIHEMWVGPSLTLCIMYLLYQEVSFAGIIGVMVVLIITPLQSYTGKLSAKYRKQTALETDERVRLMDEIISGIQVIKMYAWEKPFSIVIRSARRSEIKFITKSSYVRAAFMAFNLFTTRCALFCTILTLALTQQEITAAKAFVVMSYFNIISLSMGTLFVKGITEIAEFRVSLKRLKTFLISEEFEPVQFVEQSNGDGNFKEATTSAVKLDEFYAKWNKNNSELVLSDINLDITKGHLVGVIGPVGSGKSSLLQAILGELDVVSGTYKVNGVVSYASQEPWIFAATVRQNILFGAEFDRIKYAEVIKVCCLEKDFEQFPEGDHTIVGDRGASLSGGQKARINLARAVYRDADIYLLDDPLSAVDIHVSRRLYDDCINGYLSGKTRILVTHQVFYLKDNNNIIILDNGAIEKQGRFDELVDSIHPYSNLLITESEEETEEPAEIEGLANEMQSFRLKKQFSRVSRSKFSTIGSVNGLRIKAGFENEEDDDDKVNLKVMQEETSKGKVKGNLLLRYISAGTNCIVVLILLVLFLITQLAATGVDYWVNYYVNVEEFRSGNITESDLETKPIPYKWSSEERLIVYGCGVIGLFIIALIRSVTFYKMAMWSSENIHHKTFDNVICARMRFFDTNPNGRILNRFSKDMGLVDEALPRALLDSGQMLLNILGAVVLFIIVNPYFIGLLVAFTVIFVFLRRAYLKTWKNVKRLEGIMRSPVFTHLNATFQGLTTIRAFQQHEILQQEFDKHQDNHSGAWYMFISTRQAFDFYLDCLYFIFNTSVIFILMTLGEGFGLLGGEVGLIITQTSLLSSLLRWGLRHSAEVTNQLMSVERILEYEALPKEIQPSIAKKPPTGWPNEGKIIFDNLGLRYFPEGPLVLKDLNFVIKPKEKVGVVGRTGAGKSSLISALFRLAPVEGSMIIDGFDTKDIELETLRHKISIIPQDPVLFSGTLRYNLDPCAEYDDGVLYRAIEDVELKDSSNIINSLDNQVMYRGANYSVGQRQLICLARAIIRNNKILLLDEATANVDPQSDALIQKTIRKKFVDCTVITVAHRLNTIIDSDKVLVMDAGRVVEFDHPHLLLQNRETMFYKMVVETGAATALSLRAQAKQSFQHLLENTE